MGLVEVAVDMLVDLVEVAVNKMEVMVEVVVDYARRCHLWQLVPRRLLTIAAL